MLSSRRARPSRMLAALGKIGAVAALHAEERSSSRARARRPKRSLSIFGRSSAATSPKARRWTCRFWRSAVPRRSAATSKRWRGWAKSWSARGSARMADCRLWRFCVMPRAKPRSSRWLVAEHLLQQIGAHGHGHLGGGGGRGGAAVGYKVDQRGVGLVTDGGDKRDRTRRHRAHDVLVIEGHEVFDGAAAARDDDDVWTRDRAAGRQGVEAGDGGGDFGGRALALHGHRP